MPKRTVQRGPGLGAILVPLGILVVILIEPQLVPQLVKALVALVAAVFDLFFAALRS